LSKPSVPKQEGISEMNATSTRSVVVEAGGTQVVGHVGLHALGFFADRLGVGQSLSEAVGWRGRGTPIHDRGRVLTQAMLMLAGGGECCADIEFLGSQPRLFGSVCSDSTLYRTFTETLDGSALESARDAVAGVRQQVWARSAATTGTAPVILDLDASLVEIHSENKQGTAANFKHGYGFHPLFCFADATGEALGAMLRPGNATANDAADLLTVLDTAIDQLPSRVGAGHRPGDEFDTVDRALVARSDSAGCSAGFVEGCRARNIGFQVVARRKTAVSAAVAAANDDTDRWVPALRADGSVEEHSDGRPVAMVAEATDLVDLSSWPEGTRLIVRREPLHPGAQQTLLPDLDYRFWGHYTDLDGDPAELDRSMRAHAHVEDHISRLKDSGLLRFPFSDLAANRAWLQVLCWAADLVRWFQLLCLQGPLAQAQPKRLRWTLWHAPARIVRSARRDVIRILEEWPTTHQLLGAYRAIAAFP
jgi:hypothetical protein